MRYLISYHACPGDKSHPKKKKTRKCRSTRKFLNPLSQVGVRSVRF